MGRSISRPVGKSRTGGMRQSRNGEPLAAISAQKGPIWGFAICTGFSYDLGEIARIDPPALTTALRTLIATKAYLYLCQFATCISWGIWTAGFGGLERGHICCWRVVRDFHKIMAKSRTLTRPDNRPSFRAETWIGGIHTYDISHIAARGPGGRPDIGNH